MVPSLSTVVTLSEFVYGMLIVIILQRLSELVLAAQHRKWAIAQGGVEYGADHYWMFVVLHSGWVLSWVIEAQAIQSWAWWGIAGYVLIQVLRYWSIASLGRRWNTRIIVLPGMPPVESGPYRWLRHPNYIAVVVELALVPMLVGAWSTAMVFTILNALLLLRIRIPAEEAALRAATNNGPSLGNEPS